MTIIERIHNLQTNQIEDIERELTTGEKAALELQNEKDREREAERATKEAARAEVLAKLGLTDDEAKVLLG